MVHHGGGVGGGNNIMPHFHSKEEEDEEEFSALQKRMDVLREEVRREVLPSSRQAMLVVKMGGPRPHNTTEDISER